MQADLYYNRLLKPVKQFFLCRTLYIYEGCQKSSWTPIIKASNGPEFDIHYYISLE